MAETGNRQEQPSQQPSSQNLEQSQSLFRAQPPSLTKKVSQSLQLMWQNIIKTSNMAQFCQLIKEYCSLMVNSDDDEVFVTYFVENKLLTVLNQKLKDNKHNAELLRTTFALFQFLLKGLKKDVNLVYFLVKINQEKFVSEEYVFEEQEDQAYYANFLKLMVRTINEDSKYLTVFLNSKEPHFPLLLQLLKMYNCKDSIMQTSSKLAILEISNSPDKLVQQYMRNFPFVMFYPLYVMEILIALRKVQEDDNPFAIEALQSNLKYMEDFVQNKEKDVIDMYTNSFLRIIGRHIYHELARVSEKNVKKATKLVKIVLEHIIPEVSVVKIKIGLLCLFSISIPSKIKRCFQSKHIQLQSRYWIPDACSEQVIKHCSAIFYKKEQTSKSPIKALYSYIPRTKDNWIYHQVKKISQFIGFDIHLSSPINTETYLPDSFLNALWTMVDDQTVNNQIFNTIYHLNNEELMYNYLLLITALCPCSEAQRLINFDHIVQSLMGCTSVCLTQVFQNLVIKSQLRSFESEYIMSVYQVVNQKLTHFILTKGWKELLLRIKDSRSPINDKTFSPDIYRQIQCEVLLFASLRTLLGTNNEDCTPIIASKWEKYFQMTCETMFKGFDHDQKGSPLYVILDGQFLNIKDSQEKLINKKQLLMTDLQVFEENGRVDIVGGVKNGNFCASISMEEELRHYLLRQVANRRKMAQRISLQLKQLKFQFQYP